MSREDAPKPKKKLTKEEAVAQELIEAQMSAFQTVYDGLSSNVKDWVKPFFDEFMETVREVARNNPKIGIGLLSEVERHLPGNPWVTYQRDYLENIPPLTPEEQKKAKQDLVENVKRKIKGEDIN